MFEVGESLEIHSLKATPQHNGRRGKLLSFDPHKGRWVLELYGQLRGKLQIKPSNLKRLPASAHNLQPSELAEIKARAGGDQAMSTARVPSEVCLEWVHARMSCGCKSVMDGVPPLFPGPPLWITDVEALKNSMSRSNSALFDLFLDPNLPGHVGAYRNQCETDEVYLAQRDFACEKCGKPCPKPHISPRCRCGEAYCLRECQVADWKDHAPLCTEIMSRFKAGVLLTMEWWRHQGVVVDAISVRNILEDVHRLNH